METNNNMKDFNIAEALKYAPKGLKLYSPLLGDVRLEKVSDHDDTIVVTTKYKSERVFFEDGKYDSNGECLLFPSVNHRCWNNWQNTLFLESIGSVCVDTITGNKFILGEDGTYFGDNTGSSYHFLIDDEDASNYLLNSRYASPEEAKEFFEELNKNGYEWDGKMVVKSTSQPKFKVGDWVVYKDGEETATLQITRIVEGTYEFLDDSTLNVDDEDTLRLWDITKDAKDGDVLVNGSNIFIFHFIKGTRLMGYCHVNTDDGIFYDDIGKNECFCLIDGVVNPATKEQRDLLFQKMKEVSYEWDSDTKKLIKTTFLIPKFKIGDIIKHKDTNIINSIKRVCSNYYVLDSERPMYFEYQDMWELVASKVKPTLEEKVNILADEILALKQRVKALEIQVIKDMSTPPLTQVYSCPDKAGDNVTLEEMKS